MLFLAWLLSTMSLWMFAFYEIPSGADDWIRRAQIACFGSNESGIPGLAGWMLLILSPLAFLGAILLTLSDEIGVWLRKLLNSKNGSRFAAIMVLVILAEAIWVAASIKGRLARRVTLSANEAVEHLPSSYQRGNKAAPDFKLIDQYGKSQSLFNFRGKTVVLSFIFAHCQAVCPTLVKTIQHATDNDASPDLVSLFVTLDPWRDSPATLPGLAKEWGMGNNAFVLSGAPNDVNAVLDAYQIPRTRNVQNGDVVHPAIVQIIDKGGMLAYTFNVPSTTWLREAIARVGK